MSDSRVRGYLNDIQTSADLIDGFIRGFDFEEYKRSVLIRSAVERQLLIIGEAVSQLAKLFPDEAAKLGDVSVIIAFRNRLVHGYSAVDSAVVWGVVQDDLPSLRAKASAGVDSRTS